MMTDPKYLIVKRSTLSGAGKGLFTKTFISKGDKIVEYTGKISTWNDADHKDGKNLYIFYVNRNHVINADNHKKGMAQYANDARGITKIKGVNNNSAYKEENKRIFITATRNIAPGEEIFVGYGKEYWEVIKKG
ncbi:MAG: SET domain-containing protein-lysine N-methyltransferase [Ferruginibacter sp.]